jgi:hypothetical protein
MISIPTIYDALLDFPASFVARCHRYSVYSRRLVEIITHWRRSSVANFVESFQPPAGNKKRLMNSRFCFIWGAWHVSPIWNFSGMHEWCMVVYWTTNNQRVQPGNFIIRSHQTINFFSPFTSETPLLVYNFTDFIHWQTILTKSLKILCLSNGFFLSFFCRITQEQSVVSVLANGFFVTVIEILTNSAFQKYAQKKTIFNVCISSLFSSVFLFFLVFKQSMQWGHRDWSIKKGYDSEVFKKLRLFSSFRKMFLLFW